MGDGRCRQLEARSVTAAEDRILQTDRVIAEAEGPHSEACMVRWWRVNGSASIAPAREMFMAWRITVLPSSLS